jgi:hypothetical protein
MAVAANRHDSHVGDQHGEVNEASSEHDAQRPRTERRDHETQAHERQRSRVGFERPWRQGKTPAYPRDSAHQTHPYVSRLGGALGVRCVKAGKVAAADASGSVGPLRDRVVVLGGHEASAPDQAHRNGPYTAWPAAPFPRLSTTPIAITRFRAGSAA